MDDPILTTKQAAARLGVHHSRVRALIAEGRLPAQKLGEHGPWMIKASDLVLVEDRRPGWKPGRRRKPPGES